MANDATLASALVQLQSDLPHVGKNAQGQRSRYADLANVSKTVLTRCAELGMFFTCRPTMRPDFGFVLAYELTHVSGESRQGFYPLPKDTPQTIGGSITYARRYALLAVTGVAPDEDDDDAQAAELEARALQRAMPEVDAHGAATLAEQTRMMSGPVPGTWRSTSTAENDQWYDTPQPEPTEAAKVLREKRLKGMFAEYKRLGITDKEPMLDDLAGILGRTIESRSDLELSELLTVTQVLRRRGHDKQEAQ